MWGKLNQMVSGDQQKLENLETQLEEEQQRNKQINEQFKKVLREKEKEIQRLIASAGASSTAGSTTSSVTDDREEMREELMKLQRKVEEYQMLNMQKDENVNALMLQVAEAEELKEKVEAQERINSEKLMFELAGRIDAHEKISVKLEETKAALEQRNVALAEMADEVHAKDQMLKAKEEAVRKLRNLSPNAAAVEDLESLAITLAEKEREIAQLNMSVTHLEKELTESIANKEYKDDVGKSDNKTIESLNEKLKLKEEYIESLLRAQEEAANESKADAEEIREKNAQVEELQSLLRNLESETVSLHTSISNADAEMEKLQKLLEESEKKSRSLEAENCKIDQEYASKVEALEKVQERAKLIEIESKLFQEKYDKEVNQSRTLKEQLDKLGLELANHVDWGKKEKELLQERSEDMEAIQESLEEAARSSLSRKLLKGQTADSQKISETNVPIIADNPKGLTEVLQILEEERIEIEQDLLNAIKEKDDLQVKNVQLESMLQDQREKFEKVIEDASKLQVEMAEQGNEKNALASQLEEEIASLRLLLQSAEEQCNILSGKEKEMKETIDMLENSLALKEQEINNLQQHSMELESLLHDSTASKEKEILRLETKVNLLEKENDELKDIHDDKVTECSTLQEALEVQKELVVQSENACKSLRSQILSVEEEAEILKQQTNSHASIIKEKSLKEEELGTTISSLQAEHLQKCNELEEKLALLKNKEHEIERLNKNYEESLKEANLEKAELENRCKSLLSKIIVLEDEREGLVEQNESFVSFANVLSLKESALNEDILNLQSENMQKCNELEELRNLLREKETEIRNINENHEKALKIEYRLKSDLEDECKSLKLQISSLEADEKLIREQNISYATFCDAQSQREDEMSATIANLKTELLQNVSELENQLTIKREKELEIDRVNDNLKSKEGSLESLEKTLKEVELKYALLQEHHEKLQNGYSTKEEDIKVLNLNLRSKEDSVKLLLDQVETLNQENDNLKRSEQSLNISVSNNLEEMNIVNENLRSKEESVKLLLEKVDELEMESKRVKQQEKLLSTSILEKDEELQINMKSVKEKEEIVKTLQEEINRIELDYQNDLREAEEIYNDLQNQYEKSLESEVSLKEVLNAKNEELDTLLAERKSIIFKHNKEKSELKDSLSSQEDALKTAHSELEKKNKEFEIKLSGKEAEFEMEISETKRDVGKLNRIIIEKEESLEKIKKESMATIEDLSNETKMISCEARMLKSTLSEKDEKLAKAKEVEDDLLDTVNKRNCEIQELKEIVVSKDQDLKRLIDDLNILEMKDKEWENRIDLTIFQNETQVSSLQAELEKVTSELRVIGEQKHNSHVAYTEKELELSNAQNQLIEKGIIIKDLNFRLDQQEEAFGLEKIQLQGVISEKSKLLDETINDLKSKYEILLYEKDCENATIKSLLASKDDNIFDLEGQLKDIHNKQREFVESENALKSAEVRQLRDNIEESRIVSSNLHREVESYRNEKRELHKSLSEKEELICNLREDLLGKIQEYDQFKLLHDNKFNASNQESIAVVKELKQIAHLKSQDLEDFKVKASIELEKKKSSLNEASATISELREKEIMLADKNRELEDALMKSDKQLKDLDALFKNMKNENSDLLVVGEEAKLKVSDLQSHCDFLEDKIKISEKEVERIQQLLLGNGDNLKMTEEKIAVLSIDFKSKEQELITIKQALESFISSVNELQSCYIPSIDICNQIDKRNDEVGPFVKESPPRNQTIETNRLVKQLSQTVVQYEGILRKLQESDSEINSLKESNSSLFSQLEQIQERDQENCNHISNMNVRLQASENENKVRENMIQNKSEEIVNIMQVIDSKDEKLALIENDYSDLMRNMDDLRNELSKRCGELKVSEESHSNLQEELKSLKAKTARLVKKSQAMRNVITEKEKEIDNLKGRLEIIDMEDLKRKELLTNLENQVDNLDAECYKNKQVIANLNCQLEIFQVSCKAKDDEINQMKKGISNNVEITHSNTTPKSCAESIANVKDVSMEGSLPSEMSASSTGQDLEWDPSEYDNKPSVSVSSSSPVNDMVIGPLCVSVGEIFTESPLHFEDSAVAESSKEGLIALDHKERPIVTVLTQHVEQLAESLPDQIKDEIEEMEVDNAQSIPVIYGNSDISQKELDAKLIEKDEEIKGLSLKLNQMQEMLNKSRKKNVLMKKTQIELAKEIQLEKECSHGMEREISTLREEVNTLQGKFKLSVDAYHDMESKVENLKQLVRVVADDDDYEIDNTDAVISRLKGWNENHDNVEEFSGSLGSKLAETENVKEQVLKLKEANESLSVELKNVKNDCERLVSDKLAKEEMVEELKIRNQNLQMLNESHLEAITKGLLDISFEMDGDQSSSTYGILDANKGSDTEVLVEKIEYVREKINKFKADLIQSAEREKLSYQEKVEEEKTRAMRENEFKINKKCNQEIQSLKEELNLIAERQRNAEDLRACEELSKNEALQELENLKDELTASIYERQQASEASQECEKKLLEDIERELHAVKEKLKASKAAKDEIEAALACEALLKQQYMAENELLKSEISSVRLEEHHQLNAASDIEEIKKHKDLVIKKLKLKLRKELSEKENLNESLKKVMETSSSSMTEKENTIEQLEVKIYQQVEEIEYLTSTSMRRITEKDDLIGALKDELSWLKDSMSPLIANADRSETLLRENQNLKYCIEGKDNEIAHMREHAALKETELTYLIDQEKHAQDECSTQLQNLKLKVEEKDGFIKSLKDELQWLQSQYDDLAPKSEQLVTVQNQLNAMKEDLGEEITLRKQVERELQTFEIKIRDKENLNDNLQERCHLLQQQLDNIVSNKEEIEQLNTSFKEMEERYNFENERLAQVNESLLTREVQVEELRIEIMDKANAYEELQGILQNKDVELHQIRSRVDKEMQVITEKEKMIAELSNVAQEEQEQNFSLNKKLNDTMKLFKAKELDNDNLMEKILVLETRNIELAKIEKNYLKDQETFVMINQSLEMKDAELNDVLLEASRMKKELDSLQIEIVNKDSECCKIGESLKGLSETLNEKELLIQELTSKLIGEQEQLSKLNSKYEKAVDSLKSEVQENKQQIFFFKEMELEYSQLKETFLTQQHELSKLNQMLFSKEEEIENIKEELILAKEDEIKEQNKNLHEAMEEKVNFMEGELLRSKVALVEVQEQLHNKEEELVQMLDNLDKMNAAIKSNDTLIGELTVNLEAKDKKVEDLEIHSTTLSQRMEDMQAQHENSISEMEEHLTEKVKLHAESLQQIDMMKKLLEKQSQDVHPTLHATAAIAPKSKEISGDSSPHPDKSDDGDGWEETEGWETIDNLSETEIQFQSDLFVHENVNFVKEIAELREELEKLEDLRAHKDVVITKLKKKMRQIVAERDELKKNEENYEEVSVLKEAVEKLQKEKEHKEGIVSKLKLKLKQTIKGRDQLEENLQSELDRILQEKDLIFNEFSEKLQQQNTEMNDLRNRSEVMSETLKAVEGKLVEKEKEIETSQSSVEAITQDYEKTNADIFELKMKSENNEKEKERLIALLQEKYDIVEKHQRESSEKDHQIYNLEQEVNKFRNDLRDFEDVRSTLEEAMEIKDQALDKMRQQLDTLQREYVKLNAESQSSMNKSQFDLDEYEEKIAQLKEEVLIFQTEKENMTIKADEYKSELEAIEIMIGMSDGNSSLTEQIGSWQLQTASKIKEYERLTKDKELENNQIQLHVQSIERMCSIQNDPSISLLDRLQNINKSIHKMKGEIKFGESQLKDSLQTFNNRLQSADIAEEVIECLQIGEEQSENAFELDREGSDVDEVFSNTVSVTCKILDDKIRALTLLISELQKNPSEYNQDVDKDGNLAHVQSIIDEMSLIKTQLKDDISYSKAEWIHLQAENANLQKRIYMLTNTSDDFKSESALNLHDAIMKKNKAIVELQDSFEEVINQKDTVIDASRKRISDLRDQILDHLTASAEKDSKLSKTSSKVTSLQAQCLTLTEEIERLSENKIVVTADTDNAIESTNALDLETIMTIKEGSMQGNQTDGIVNDILDNSTPQPINVLGGVVDLEKIEAVLCTIEKSFNLTNQDDNLLDKRLEEIKLAISNLLNQSNEYKMEIEDLLATKNANEDLKKILSHTKELLEAKSISLNETLEELKEKSIECSELLEENADFKEEINDLKESMQEMDNINSPQKYIKEKVKSLSLITEKMKDEIQNNLEKISDLESSKISFESQLREKDHVIMMRDTCVEQMTNEKEERDSQLIKMQSMIEEVTSSNEKLEKDNMSKQNEIIQLCAETENLKKQIDLLAYASDESRSESESNLQIEISKKNKSFLELRDSFEDVITQKDKIIDTLRKQMNVYRDENLGISQKNEENVKFSEKLYAEKDKTISDISKKLADIGAENNWLRQELDHVINEKNVIAGVMQDKFEDISSGLRGDLELALTGQKEYDKDLEIQRLKMEQQLISLKDELSSSINKLKLKEDLLHQKNIVINNLQNQIEDTAKFISEKKWYDNMQEQLTDSKSHVENLTAENQNLTGKLSQVTELYESLKLEMELLENEKNQTKLESDTQIDHIMIKNAEDMQHLRSSLETTLNEKDNQISELSLLLANIKVEDTAAVQSGQNQLQATLAMVEENYQKQINELESQLDVMLNRKEENIKEVVTDFETLDVEQLIKVKGELDNLLSAKDGRMKFIALQLSEKGQKCEQLNESVEAYKENIKQLTADLKSKANIIRRLQNEKRKINSEKESEIEKIIISKGKHLKDLREEFEAVFNDKNSIIEGIRNTLKSSREELLKTQQQLRTSNEDYRKIECRLTEMETDKFQVEAKLSSLIESNAKISTDLESEKNKNNERSIYIENIVAENSNLKLSCRKLENVLEAIKKTEDISTYYNLTHKYQSVESLRKFSGENDDKNVDNDLNEYMVIETLENDLQDTRKTSMEMENILMEVNRIISSIPSLNSSDNSLSSLQERCKQLVNKIFQADHYFENLSEKLFELISPNSDNGMHSETESSVMMKECQSMDVKVIADTKNDALIQDFEVDKTATDGELKPKLEEVYAIVNKLAESISQKDMRIEILDAEVKSLKQDSLVHKDTLKGINKIMEDVPELNIYDYSINGVYEKTQKLVASFMSSQKYCDELSKKLYEFMEQRPVQDFSSQCEDENKEVILKTLEDHINYLQKELVQVVAEKESVQTTVREKYDDILGNLRGDLEASNKGYKLLQEENFALQNQIETFTNVNSKRLQIDSRSMESLNSVSDDSLSPGLDVSSPSKYSEREFEQISSKLEGSSEKEISVLRTSTMKLKKLCRKYKSESQSYKDALDQQTEEVHLLESKLSTLNDFLEGEKHTYDQEIKLLREEVNVLVEEKVKIVDSFKQRSAIEINRMKEMYQISLNQFTHDVQKKDNMLEKSKSEIDRLNSLLNQLTENHNDTSLLETHNTSKQTLSISPSGQRRIIENREDGELSSLEKIDLLKRINIMDEQMNRLNEEKMKRETQVKAQREEIAELVETRDHIVTLWQSKVVKVNEEKEELTNLLRSEIEELNKKLQYSLQENAVLNDTIHDAEQMLMGKNCKDEIPTHQNVDENLNIREKLQSNAKCRKLYSDVLENFPVSREELENVKSLNREKDLKLQAHESSMHELKLKFNHQNVICKSLFQEIALVKSEKEDAEKRLINQFDQVMNDLVNENVKLKEDLIDSENIIEGTRLELKTCLSEKEFLTAVVNRELPVSEKDAFNIHHLKVQNEQIERQKNESKINLTGVINKLKSDIKVVSQEKAESIVRISMLRALLEQETKEHEKTRTMKEAIAQNQGLMLTNFKSTVSNLSHELKILRKELTSNLSTVNVEYKNFFMCLIPSMISEEYEFLRNKIRKKDEEISEKDAFVSELTHSKQVAESRLMDVVLVLQEIGAIEKVQAKLLEKESSLKSLHQQSAINEKERIEELEKRLQEKDKIIADREDKLTVLEESLRFWHEQKKDTVSQISSEIIDWPESDQSSVISDMGSMISYGSRSFEPSTPAMERK